MRFNWYHNLMGHVRCKNCKRWTKKSRIWGAICSFKCDNKYVRTMEEENEVRMNIGYPYMIRIVDIPCPKCKGKMCHDDFNKAIIPKTRELLAMYNCIKCKYEQFFNLTKNKWDKKYYKK